MKKKIPSIITILVFFGLLFGVMVLSLVLPDREVSIAENRMLTQRPVNDLSDLTSLTAAYTDYVVDQFPGREALLKYYTMLELAQGKREIRDTYVLDDGWLMTKTYPIWGEEYLSYAMAVTEEKTPGAKFVYAVLPDKNAMLAELAENIDGAVHENNRAAFYEAMAYAKNVEIVDVSAAMLERFTLEERMKLFYRTDIHWNYDGAFYAAEQIAAALSDLGLTDGAEIPTTGDFQHMELGAERLYEGDLNRRFSNLLSMEEKIPYYCIRDTEELRYYFSLDDSEPAERSEVVGSGLSQERLDYNGLSTYNLGYYRVENPNARSNRHIIILKDSYQNPTTDYFTELYEQVTVIDLRYYELPQSLPELAELSDASVVLFMFHQNNVSRELIEFLSR